MSAERKIMISSIHGVKGKIRRVGEGLLSALGRGISKASPTAAMGLKRMVSRCAEGFEAIYRA